MNSSIAILIAEAMAAYVLVLLTHAMRRRVGLAPFHALLGGMTAVMSWVTDAGVHVDAGAITFVVGSSVFYTAILLGVFMVYVFDGPEPTRTAILTVAGVSALVPVISVVLHLQMNLGAHGDPASVPMPSLRINTASVLTTIADLVFLAVLWEFLGKRKARIGLWIRAFLALLGVMWLDVLLFSTGAFFGRPEYVSIMKGTFLSRAAIATFAWPFLNAYLAWQTRLCGAELRNRPVLAILREVAQVRGELTLAKQEIDRIREVERALQESEAKFRSIVDNIGIGVALISPKMEILELNRQMREWFPAVRPGDGILCYRHFNSPPRLEPCEYCPTIKTLRDGQVHEAVTATPADARIVRFRVVSSPIFDKEGRVTAVIEMVENVTERLEMEARLKQQERLASIGALARGMAHEINNPIMGAMNYAQIIKDRSAGHPDVAEFAEGIIVESGRVATLTHNLLAFTEQLETHPSVPVLPGDLVADVLPVAEQAARERGIVVSCDVPVDLPPVECSRDQIAKALAALLMNAVEAFDEGVEGNGGEKKIKVSAREVSSDTAQPPADTVRLTVEDNGAGIADAVRERIFDPFVTTKDRTQHPGLGLWICRSIVRQNGGELRIESVVGQFTRLHLDLPAHVAPAGAHGMTPPPEAPHRDHSI